MYFIRTGSVKSCFTSTAGDELVVSFHLPGELLGLDGLFGSRVHTTSAIALEGTEVCVIPAAQLEWFVRHTRGAQGWLFGLAGNEVAHYHRKLLMLNKMKAEARLSHFLLDLSKRFCERGYSASEFNLSMSRQDIANHLGIAIETVSRLMSIFQKDGLLEVSNLRQITIRDEAGLAVR